MGFSVLIISCEKVYNKCELRQREEREGEVGARTSYVINNDLSQWRVLSDR